MLHPRKLLRPLPVRWVQYQIMCSLLWFFFPLNLKTPKRWLGCWSKFLEPQKQRSEGWTHLNEEEQQGDTPFLWFLKTNAKESLSEYRSKIQRKFTNKVFKIFGGLNLWSEQEVYILSLSQLWFNKYLKQKWYQVNVKIIGCLHSYRIQQKQSCVDMYYLEGPQPKHHNVVPSYNSDKYAFFSLLKQIIKWTHLRVIEYWMAY